MRNTRPARALIAGAGIAVAALTLAACGSGAAPASSTSASTQGSTQAPGSATDGGNAAGIIESGSGEADPELVADKLPAPIDDKVTGREYVATTIEGFTPAKDSQLRVAFPERGRISILGGCNTLFGDVTWQDSVLLAPTLASTMMACDEALMDQDRTMTELLAHGVTVDLAGDRLTLRTDDVTIELVEDANAGIGDMEQPIPTPGETPAHPGTDQPDTAGAGSNDGIGPMETLSPAPGETPAYPGD